MDQRLVATTLIRDTWIHTEETQVGPMWTDTRDTSVGKFIRDGIAWADGELAYLRAVVKPGMRVVDVGANVGFMARFCGDLVGPTGKVTAIEADPDTAELLRMNADWWLLQNIRVLEVAVGADRGELTIWKNPYGNLGGNRAAPFPGDDAGSHVVERWPLDELLGADYPVDVVKVDVEGMDHEVIFGMREIYRRWHPAILAEFNVAAMRAMGTDPVGVLQAYQANGFAPRLLAADATMLSQLLKVNMAALLGPELLVAGHENEVVELVTRVDLVNLVM